MKKLLLASLLVAGSINAKTCDKDMPMKPMMPRSGSPIASIYQLGKSTVLPLAGLYLFYKYTLHLPDQYANTTDSQENAVRRKTAEKALDLLAGVIIFESVKSVYKDYVQGPLNSLFNSVENALGLQ
ncbi:MAG: hypothetical protein AB7R69_05615 [Candidatus Babeliales bacterium]